MTSPVAGVVSVLIVNFRSAEDTIAAVDAVAAVDWPADRLEVVVVENGSGDGSLEALQSALGERPGVVLVPSSTNEGFTGGVNRAAAAARGEFLALLNSDAKPEAGWIREAMAQFAVSPLVAAVASRVLDEDGRAIDFDGGAVTWFGMGYKERVGSAVDGSSTDARDVLYGTGSALLVRAAVFHEVGGLDERFFMFYDDVDLGWNLTIRGYRVRYAPTSVVRHRHHGSMGSFGEYREHYLLERNALFLMYKYLDDENLGRLLPAAMALSARRGVSRGDVDSEAFDIRRFSGALAESEEAITVPKDALAGFLALDQFVEHLDTLADDRARIQAARTRTDAEVFGLFGDSTDPLFGEPAFLDGLQKIRAAFDVSRSTRRRRVLVITGDALGVKMAGPGMRAWRIADALAADNDVRLVTWNRADRRSDRFAVNRVRVQNERDMAPHEAWADVIVFQGAVLRHFRTIADSAKVLVADIYDPLHLEQLEQGRDFGDDQWRRLVADATEIMNDQLRRADFFLCASERQRLFWLGHLAALGRINPLVYAADPRLERLLAVVPFGLDEQAPVRTRKAIRGVVPGIDENTRLLIWGGGIYNWFDTLTLVRAVAIVARTRPEVALFFLGVAHPNPDQPEMSIVAETRRLAAELGVSGTNVFFNEEWVDLDDRHNYLLDADAGVSTHYDHVETMFSFRTRILDYLWAGLPIVSTEGDSFGDLVTAEGLGVAVPERDAEALAAAIERVLFDDEESERMRENVRREREAFFWGRALAPLVEFCRDPRHAPDRAEQFRAAEGPTRRGATPKAKDRDERFWEITRGRHGVRRDVELALFYLREDGVRGVVRKARSRLDIMRRGANG